MFEVGQLVWMMHGDWQNPEWEIVLITDIKPFGKMFVRFLDVDDVITPAEVDISRLREIAKPTS